MRDLEVIDDPKVATAVLGPMRARVLAELREPGSATTVAATLGETRQKVNYHLRALEAVGLVREVGERPKRGLTERLVVASARSYVVSSEVLGEGAATPERTDKLSSRYLIAVAARIVREGGRLVGLADATGRPLATLTLDSELRFASAAERAAFTAELTEASAQLVRKYHDEAAPRGRWHRLVVAAYPINQPAHAAEGPIPD